jgi:hypothetical protein
MPTGSQAEKERKRYIVAVGVITGKSRAVIAQEVGCQARLRAAAAVSTAAFPLYGPGSQRHRAGAPAQRLPDVA